MFPTLATPVHVDYTLTYILWSVLGIGLAVAFAFALRADLRNRARVRSRWSRDVEGLVPESLEESE